MLYPAIDLRGGQVVRLRQGDYDDRDGLRRRPGRRRRSTSPTPGATWIHVVDLDAARTGDPVNRPVVAAIAAAVAGRAHGADRRRRARRSTTPRRSPTPAWPAS